jgi:hypothetical protein
MHTDIHALSGIWTHERRQFMPYTARPLWSAVHRILLPEIYTMSESLWLGSFFQLMKRPWHVFAPSQDMPLSYLHATLSIPRKSWHANCYTMPAYQSNESHTSTLGPCYLTLFLVSHFFFCPLFMLYVDAFSKTWTLGKLISIYFRFSHLHMLVWNSIKYI